MRRVFFVQLVGSLLAVVGLSASTFWGGAPGAALAQPPQTQRWSAFRVPEVDRKRKEADRKFEEFLRVPDLSAGLYVLGKSGVDRQKPHSEDEIYYIVSGKGVLKIDDHDEPVSAGSVVYVAAKVPHHFHSIEEELKILVVFAPAFGTRTAK